MRLTIPTLPLPGRAEPAAPPPPEPGGRVTLGADAVDAWLGGGLKADGLHEAYAQHPGDTPAALAFLLHLDVTRDLKGIGSATRIAELIRERIRAETGLTASAGVSYNKFLAKLASDQNKPDGLCVIRPGEGAQFVAALPVRRFHGVGPRGAEKMAALGIATGADLRAKDIAFLREHFGAQADYLYRAVRGIDLRPVRANRPRKSIGAERTFDRDISTGPVLREALANILDLVWADITKAGAKGRTVTLKLRLSDFSLRTHARSLDHAVAGQAELAEVARGLLDDLLPLPQAVRLMGVTLSGLEGPGQPAPEPAPPAGQMALF